MDSTLFQAAMPGQLVEIGGNDFAFLPAPLPPKSWTFPADLWPLLSEAKQELGVLDQGKAPSRTRTRNNWSRNPAPVHPDLRRTGAPRERQMERHRGLEPRTSGWKPDTSPVRHMTHGGAVGSRTLAARLATPAPSLEDSPSW